MHLAPTNRSFIVISNGSLCFYCVIYIAHVAPKQLGSIKPQTYRADDNWDLIDKFMALISCIWDPKIRAPPLSRVKMWGIQGGRSIELITFGIRRLEANQSKSDHCTLIRPRSATLATPKPAEVQRKLRGSKIRSIHVAFGS